MACINLNAVLNHPEFPALQEKYPDMDKNYLAEAISMYWDYHEQDGWFPQTSQDKGKFTYFMRYRLPGLKQASTASLSDVDDVEKAYDILSVAYTPTQLDDRTDLIASDFSNIVTGLVDEYREKNGEDIDRLEAIRENGGYRGVAKMLFDEYESYTLEDMLEMYPIEETDSDAVREQKRNLAQYRLAEFKKMAKYRNYLAMHAANKIGEKENLIVTYTGAEIDLESVAEYEDDQARVDANRQEVSNQDNTESIEGGENVQEGEENPAEDPEATKGDRYIDFRSLKLVETLSVEANNFLASIPLINASGTEVTDDMNFVKTLNSRQVAYSLIYALQNSTPNRMMQDLEASCDRFPFLRGVIEMLEEDKDLRTLVWCNFHRVGYTYSYGRFKNGTLEVSTSNTKALGNSLMRAAGNYMRSGYVLNGEKSIYDSNGKIRSDIGTWTQVPNEDGSGTHSAPVGTVGAIIKSLSQYKALKFVNTVRDRATQRIKIKDEEIRNKYNEVGGVDGIEAFLEDNPEFVTNLTEALRGLGFDVSEENIRDAAVMDISEKSLEYFGGDPSKFIENNRISLLVKAVESAYKNATKLSGSDASTFYDTTSLEYRRINAILALSLMDELEPRSLENGKSLQTFNNTSLLREVVNELSNADGRDDAKYVNDLVANYLQYEGYTDAQGNPTGWLKDLLEGNSDFRREFSVTDMTHWNDVEYAKLSRAQKAISMFVSWIRPRSSSGFRMYEVPIQSDYETAWNFIVAPTYSIDVDNNELFERILDEVRSEYERMRLVNERIQADPDGEHRRKLDVYEKNGIKFQIFPEFNTNGFIEGFESLASKSNEQDKFLRDAVTKQLEKILARDAKTMEESGMFQNPLMKSVYNGSEKLNFYIDGEERKGIDDFGESEQNAIREFILNSFYARYQMVKIFDGDLSHFNGLLDYEKRNMRLHAPHSSLYTDAWYKGEHIGKDSENVMCIGDEVSGSAYREEFAEALDALYRRGMITKRQRNRMIKSYDNIKSSDGQGLRTFDSFREISIMSGGASGVKWTDEHERVYQRIKNHTFSKKDVRFVLDTIMAYQNMKPVLSGYEFIEAAAGEGQKPIKVPILHKYAEMVLLPQELSWASPQLDSSMFGGLSKAMDRLGRKVDLFLFTSGWKVGPNSQVEPFGFVKKRDADGNPTKENVLDENGNPIRVCKTADQVADYIVKASEDSRSIHNISLKYFGITASMPTHGYDEDIAWSSQAQKNLWSNYEDDETLTVEGESMPVSAAHRLNDEIDAATVVEAYQKLLDIIGNPNELDKLLQTELAQKSYRSREMFFALTRLKDGNFAAPLFSPGTMSAVEQLLLSMIKKRLTRPWTKGANMVQVTSLGLDVDPFDKDASMKDKHKLKIEWEGKGDKKRIKHVECYMSIHDKRLLRFVDENGVITPERLERLVSDGIIDESVLQFVAYRTPSDDIHSIIPLRIKGFTSTLAGQNIIVPKEIMNLTGHDFDGDKLRCHFMEFDVLWDEDLIASDYEDMVSGEEAVSASKILSADPHALDSLDDYKKFLHRRGNVFAQDYIKLKKVAYDYRSDAVSQSQSARNNAKVELAFARLTSPEGTQMMVMPGGCDDEKILAKTIYLTTRIADNENVQAILRSAGINPNDTVAAYDYFASLDDKQLSSYLDIVNGEETPFNVTHAIDSYEYMMGGAEMIGIEALYSSAKKWMQQLGLEYIPTKTKKGKPHEVSLFGHKPISKLYEVRTLGTDKERGTLSSVFNAQSVNAAVDNGKDPILGYINMNPQMAPIANFLDASGLEMEEVLLFLNQPAMVELAKRMKVYGAGNIVKVVDEMANSLVGDGAEKRIRDFLTPKGALRSYKGLDLIAKKRADDYKRALGISYSGLGSADNLDILEMQLSVLGVVKEVNDAAEDLSTFIRVTRPEAARGGIDTNIAGTIVKSDELEEFRKKVKKNPDAEEISERGVRISGIKEIIRERDIQPGMSSDAIMAQLGDKAQRIVAQNTMLVDGSLDLLSWFFPQARKSWRDSAKQIAKMYNYKKLQKGTVKKVLNDMLLWKLLSNKGFIQDLKATQKDIVVNLPKRLQILQDKINEIGEYAANGEWDKISEKDRELLPLVGNKFLKKLEIFRPESAEELPRIKFNAGGATIEGFSDEITNAWSRMMKINPEVSKMATDLLKYNILTSGLAFGMYEFIHFVPMNVALAVPGYTDAMNSILRTNFNLDSLDGQRFIDQYFQNHWGDERLMPWINSNNVPMGNEDWSPEMLKKIKGRRFFLMVQKDEQGGQQTVLMRIVKDDTKKSGIWYKMYPKVGVRGYYGQMSYVYNPELDGADLEPIQTGYDSNWGHSFNENLNMFGEADYESENPNAMSDDEQMAYDRDVVDRAAAFEPNRPGKHSISSQLQESAEKSNEHNEETLKKLDAPQESLDSMAASALIGAIPSGFFQVSRRALNKDGEAVVETEEYPIYARSINLARRQRVYVELNKRLRQLLDDYNKRQGPNGHKISIGVISDAEERMFLDGVTDFDTAKVTAEGFLEMIRVGNGKIAALPEEFAHLSLAMLGKDNPLVQRLTSGLKDNQAVLVNAFDGQEEYDYYDNLYRSKFGEDADDAMAFEGAGKLVSKHLFLQQSLEGNPFRKLIYRIGEAIKAMFRKFSTDDVKNAIYDAEHIASQVARNLLSGRILDQMSFENISQSGAFHQVKTDITRRVGILNNILKTELKKLGILGKRKNPAESDKLSSAEQAALNQIRLLEKGIEEHKTEAALLDYMERSLNMLADEEKSLDAALKYDDRKANDICKKLTNTRDVIDSYASVLNDISKAVEAKELSMTKELSDIIDKANGQVRKFYEKCDRYGLLYFEEALRSVYGENGRTITLGKNKGQRISIEEIATRSPGDINLAKRWLYSLADCGDDALSAIDDIVKRAKMRAREVMRTVKPKIEVAVADLVRETGSRDQRFMFEYKNGHKTGKYISSEQAAKLSPAQQKFYNRMLAIKDEVDALMPPSFVTDNKIVMLRKGTLQRVRDAEGFNDKKQEFWEAVKNSVLDTSDNVDFDYKEVSVDFLGNKVDRLVPMYMSKGINESFDDMTDDVANSILAYAGMGYEYAEMNNVIGILENAKYMIAKRDVEQHYGGRALRETIGEPDPFIDTPAGYYYHSAFTVKQARTNLQEILDDYFSVQVYGHSAAREGTFMLFGKDTHIDKKKTANAANTLASWTQMAFNLQQRITNVSVGLSNILIETAGNGVYNAKDLKWAIKEYMKQSGDRLMDSGKTESDNYLTLFMEKFDVLQENGKNKPKYTKGRMSKLFGTHLVFAGLQMGEDALAATTALAAAKNFTVLDDKGQKRNIYEAYTVKYLDKANKTGAHLELKKGWTKTDGSEITLKDEQDFTLLVAGTNFRLQGIYNKDDKSAAQSYALGSLLIMYRKWIAPALVRRYGKAQYNSLTQREEEGYWITTGRYLMETMQNIFTEGQGIKNSFLLNYGKLNDYEKSNLRRAMTEFGIVFGSMLALWLLGKLPDDKEDQYDSRLLAWADSEVLLLLMRTKNEIGAVAPTPLMLKEGLNLLGSPFAAIKPMKSMLDGLKLFWPPTWWQKVKTGRYAGKTKAYKYIRNLPVISMYKQVEHLIDPSPIINYYKNDRI